MSAVIYDGFESDHQLVHILTQVLTEQGIAFSHLRLRNMQILPCRSCGSCGLHTPGKCALKDQTEEMMKATAPSNKIILLTPIRFGGYSSQLKKAMDKWMLLGLPLYFAKNGRLFHPSRYGHKTLLAIGLAENSSPGENNNFLLTVERNAQNLQYTGKTLICQATDTAITMGQEIRSFLM